MKIRQISLQSPAINVETTSYINKVLEYIEGFKETLKKVTSSIYNIVASFVKRKKINNSETQFSTQTKRGLRFPSFKNKNFWGSLLVIITVPWLFIAGSKLIKTNPTEEGTEDNRVDVKGAIATTEVGREFTFPLNSTGGEEVSRIKYEIERAELKDEIITEGKRATAVKGRMFLILILKITNQYDKAIKINTRDYVRLSVNGNDEELLAPETHNDPVEIQAISTKYTRVGFIVNDTDKDFVLHVGQIKGDKEKVELDLK
jgi:hypothetical protein